MKVAQLLAEPLCISLLGGHSLAVHGQEGVQPAVLAFLVIFYVEPRIPGRLKDVLGDQRPDLELGVSDAGDGLCVGLCQLP